MGLPFALVSGMLVGPIFLLSMGLPFALGNWLLVGLSVGLIIGLLGILPGLLLGRVEKIEPVDKLDWSWRDFTNRKLLLTGLLSMLLCSLPGLLTQESGLLLVGLFIGLLVGLLVGLLGGAIELFSGQRKNTKVSNSRTRPNQGIWLSARNGLIFGLLGLPFGLAFGLAFGLLGGLQFGLIGGLPSGGSVFIQHFSLRLTLKLGQVMPWRYVTFLDYAADCILLQKVGPGYRFVHRTLQEHFAAKYAPPLNPPQPLRLRSG